MFVNIPAELIPFRQYVVWRYEEKEPGKKPTKVPYNPKTGTRASSTDPSTWSSYKTAINVAAQYGYDGIGFVLTEGDPFTFIDLDFTENELEKAFQTRIFNEFDSYSEISPSGNGLHIIIKANVDSGRKRHSVEIYSKARYMTLTGRVYLNKPIAERQYLAKQLWQDMGPTVVNGQVVNFETQPSTGTNDAILEKGASAVNNGVRFKQLWEGKWQDADYPSQSEADFAFIDMLAMLTPNKEQIKDIFLNSWLGARKKALRNDYVDNMINRSFDRVLGDPAWLADLKKMGAAQLASFQGGKNEPSAAPSHEQEVTSLEDRSSDQAVTQSADQAVAYKQSNVKLPPGLMGDIAKFMYEAAPRPVPEIALCAAIGLMAGICGRAYNTPTGAGLNLYTILVAKTAVGKEAMASGISKLMTQVKVMCPGASTFEGPAEIASGPALLRRLEKQPSMVAIQTEFGILLNSMCGDHTPPHLLTLRRVLLDAYSKSGHHNVLRSSVYSEAVKNIPDIPEPAFSLLAETTPSTFYENLDESLVAQGLISRLFVMEYDGDRVANNKTRVDEPTKDLATRVAQLCTNSMTLQQNKAVLKPEWSPEAEALSEKFDRFCDQQVNKTDVGAIRDLWGRAHLKVMKIASLLAISVNIYSPEISAENWDMAQEWVVRDVQTIVKRFQTGEVGKEKVEPIQVQEVKRVIREYIRDYQLQQKIYTSAGINESMLKDGIVSYNLFSVRLTKLAAFNKGMPMDRGSNAIRRALKIVCDEGYLFEIPPTQRLIKYQTGAPVYQIRKPPEDE